MVQTVVSKFQTGKCLNVVTIGGSVCLGSSFGDRNVSSTPRGPEDAFPKLFETLLRNGLVCDGGQHEVYNGCVYAVASDHWVDQLARKDTDLSLRLQNADLVVVDTSVNDFFDLPHNPGLHSNLDNTERDIKLTEIIAHMIFALPKTPTLLYLGTSDHKAGNPAHPGNMIEAQNKVAAYYGFPCVSAVAGLSIDTAAKESWFSNVFRADACCHPSVLGHQIIAHTLMAWLTTQASGVRAEWPTGRTIPPPQWNTQQSIKSHVNNIAPRYFDATTQYASAPLDAWRVVDEGKNGRKKIGLVSTMVDSIATWNFQPEQTIRTSLHVEYLRSYEHMGRFELAQCAANVTNPAKGVIDGLWETKESQLQVEVFPIRIEPNQPACFTVRVLETTGRSESKVKITSFLLFA